jgi:hypothetical protein
MAMALPGFDVEGRTLDYPLQTRMEESGRTALEKPVASGKAEA